MLYGRILKGSNRMELKSIRAINLEESSRFDTACEGVGNFVKSHALHVMCEGNYADLVTCYDQARKDFAIAPAWDTERANRLLNGLNRHLMNYLASWMSLVEHQKTRYRQLERKGVRYRARFDSLREEIETGSFHYRFFARLRNYVQHCGLPLDALEASLWPDSTGALVPFLAVSFDRDVLLMKYNEWKDVKSELKLQPEKLELGESVAAFRAQVIRFVDGCMTFEIEIVKEYVKQLDGLVAEVEARMPGAEVMISETAGMSRAGGTLPSRLLPMDDLELIKVLEREYSEQLGP